MSVLSKHFSGRTKLFRMQLSGIAAADRELQPSLAHC